MGKKKRQMYKKKYAGHPRSKLNKAEEVVEAPAPAPKPVEVEKPKLKNQEAPVRANKAKEVQKIVEEDKPPVATKRTKRKKTTTKK